MNRLFRLEKQINVSNEQTVPASCPAIDVSEGSGGTLKISMGEAQGSVPKEVQLAYRTTTGETQYFTFIPPCPSPGHLSVSERPCISGPSANNILGSTDVQLFSGNRLGTQETGVSSLDALHLKASAAISDEESRDS